jgi:hypothetical protein
MDLLAYGPIVGSLIGALGIGSVLGTWLTGGQARREVRSKVLAALAETEQKRWAGDGNYHEFNIAVRRLETAALVARVPRKVVLHYVVLAQTANYLSRENYEELGGDEDMGAGAINGYYAGHVRDAAEIITLCVWRPWWSKLTVPNDLRKLRSQVLALDDTQIQQKLALMQKHHGVLPGPLGQLPGIKSPPPRPEPEEK